MATGGSLGENAAERESRRVGSPGCVIAFHKHRADLSAGDLGVLCSFGAGSSVGSVVIRRG